MWKVIMFKELNFEAGYESGESQCYEYLGWSFRGEEKSS